MIVEQPSYKNPKCLMFISMLYICILLGSAIVGNKEILTSLGTLSAASLTGPLWFILSDIVAEVYGYPVARKMLFTALVCELIIILVIEMMISLPSPKNWDGWFAYSFVTGELVRIYFSQLIGVIVSGLINIRILTKWRFLLRGKYFWLRSIGSSGISEIIFSITSVGLILMGRFPFQDVISMVVWSFTLKIVFSFPATFVVMLLQYIEQDMSDNIAVLRNPLRIVNELKDGSKTN